MPDHNPNPPPNNAIKKKRFSGIRQTFRLEALLSIAHIIKFKREVIKIKRPKIIVSVFSLFHPFVILKM